MKTLQDAMREITNLLSGEPSEENVSEAYNIASQFREPSTEQSEEIPDDVAWSTLIKCNNDLSSRMEQSEAKLKRIVEVIESEIKEIPKLQDFASGHGDAQGYARACGQQVLLQRLFERFSRIIKSTEQSGGTEQEVEIWMELYNAMDEAARNVDSYDFGLPRYGAEDIILKLKERFSLTRKP